MSFVGSIPGSKTLFESFVFSNFGMNVDLSENTTFAVAVGVAVALFAFSRLYGVAKYR